MSFYRLSFRKALDFFSILLLLITLCNSLIVSNSCSTDWLIFAVRSYAHSDNFTASFTIFIPLISFSYIIKLATCTRTMVNNSDEGGQPCVVLTLMEYSHVSSFTVRLPLGSGMFDVHLLLQGFIVSRKHFGKCGYDRSVCRQVKRAPPGLLQR